MFSARKLVSGVLALGAAGTLVAFVTATPRSETTYATPVFGSATVESLDRAAFVRHVRTLRFDESHYATETDRLVLSDGSEPGSVRLGPVAKLAPEIGAARIPDSEFGRGHVLARITVQQPVPELGYGAGHNYFLVLGEGDDFRALIVPEDASVPVSERPVTYRHGDLGPAPPFAFARLTSNGYGWVRCGRACCAVADG